MAKAKAECTCSVCGEKFAKIKDCHSRKEADAWEEWASGAYDLCGSCYFKQKDEKEKEKGLYIDVCIDCTCAIHNDNQCVAIVFGGDTMPYKDAIKGLGAIWTDDYPDIGSSSVIGQRKWVLWSDIGTMGYDIQHAKDIGASVNSMPSKADEDLYYKFLFDRQAKDAKMYAAMQKEIDAIGKKPDWSSDIKEFWKDDEKWNHKFYGKQGKWSIYLSGRKIDLTDEQKASMEHTMKEREEWAIQIKEIKSKYKEKR